ncbi:hypothetical protein EF405_17330 [Cyclobacteriaceae bacterium YHN15]|jgi:hypothetical protein|nr:hypothetical protein EF405_17330 [Cyclobacteriaceae bacterium YHN15]
MSEQVHPIKSELLQKAQGMLREQIRDVQLQLSQLQESSETEEKSSAGDKFETHQEMLNQTRDMLQKSLAKDKILLAQLNAVPIKTMERVEEGAILELSIGKIWVSVPIGKVNLNGIDYQLVSKDSPLINVLWNLKTGDPYDFRGKKEKILAVY